MPLDNGRIRVQSPEYSRERLPCLKCGSLNTTTIRVAGLHYEEPVYFLHREKQCRDCGHKFTSTETHGPIR
jgi:transcriptional regulator NrdR family protein